MAKGSHTSSILTGKDKRCYLTGETRGLEKHRGTGGVHGRDGHALDLRLKQDCQRRFEEAHSREEFMAIIGRNYLL